MGFIRDMDGSEPLRWEPITRVGGAHEERRRSTRSWRLASGTLACERCDAPVALGGVRVAPADLLSCPYCSHRAPARDFLSLATPPRPARVDVWVAAPLFADRRSS